jgi:DNA-binding LytR/AlgR family response regulator
MKINYLIIDDEPISHKIIQNYCNDLSYMNLIGNCYSAIDAVPFLNEYKIDLIFLDIKMPQISGFDFLKTLPSLPQIIIVSAHKEYALESYEYTIADYLLKPFNFERFFKAIQKVISNLENDSTPNLINKKNESIFIKDGKKHHKVDLADIIYIEASGNYSLVYLKNGKILSQTKISDFESLLPKNNFSRIHKSFLISHNAVTLITSSEVHIDKSAIPIGRVYKDNVAKIIKKN